MMKRYYKTGTDRDASSLLPPRLDDYVGPDNVVRAIDAYVDTVDLTKAGFVTAQPSRTGTGQPAYDPAMLLKLYLYGYMNRVHSSRRLERETARNLEVIWLTGDQAPCHKTIANFRKDNPEALAAVNKDFVLLCRELKLFGGALVAIDGSFFHGNAGKASISTQKKLDSQLKKIEAEIAAYQEEMARTDSAETKSPLPAQTDSALAEKLEKLAGLQARKAEKQAQVDRLEESGETQLSTTDPDARLLNKGHGEVAGYNVQTAVDSKHRLIIASEVTSDSNDLNQLQPMTQKAREALGAESLDAVLDAGYFNAAQLKECEDNGITAYVPEPDRYAKARKEGRFTPDRFTYDEARDAYICPQGERLEKSSKPLGEEGSLRLCYTISATTCKACPLKEKCLSEKATSRKIYRSEHEKVLERHRERMAGDGAKGMMRKRSGMAEHPFGTLKCRAGWQHFLVRTLKKVRGEWSLMATCYNFTRVITLIGVEGLRAYCALRVKLG